MTTGKAPTLYQVRTMARTSKVLDMVDSPACPSPPPFRPHVTVPFLWEDAPGKPKLRATPPTAPSAAAASPVLADGRSTGAGVAGAPARPVLLKLPPRLQAAEYSLSSSPKTVLHGPYSGRATSAKVKVAGDHDDAAPARPALLKLPPRLQAAEYSLSSSPKTVLHGPYSGRATAAKVKVAGDHDDAAPARPVLLKLPPRLQATEYSLSSSPKTVLHGPYSGLGGGGNKPPRPLRRIASTASCVGGGLFVWRKATATAPASASAGSKKGYAVAPDASCSSPAASSASSSSSSSSSSMSYFFDDHSSRGAHWRQVYGREDSGDGEGGDDGAKGSVRITRFRRNRSLPTMSGWHLWANIRKGVKQISPWSQKPT